MEAIIMFVPFDRAFQDHTEKMKEKLHKEMTQKVDDEDARIAKAVEERERKRLVSTANQKI